MWPDRGEHCFLAALLLHERHPIYPESANIDKTNEIRTTQLPNGWSISKRPDKMPDISFHFEIIIDRYLHAGVRHFVVTQQSIWAPSTLLKLFTVYLHSICKIFVLAVQLGFVVVYRLCKPKHALNKMTMTFN